MPHLRLQPTSYFTLPLPPPQVRLAPALPPCIASPTLFLDEPATVRITGHSNVKLQSWQRSWRSRPTKNSACSNNTSEAGPPRLKQRFGSGDQPASGCSTSILVASRPSAPLPLLPPLVHRFSQHATEVVIRSLDRPYGAAGSVTDA